MGGDGYESRCAKGGDEAFDNEAGGCTKVHVKLLKTRGGVQGLEKHEDALW